MKKILIALLSLSALSFAYAGTDTSKDQPCKCGDKCTKQCCTKDSKACAKDAKACEKDGKTCTKSKTCKTDACKTDAKTITPATAPKQ